MQGVINHVSNSNKRTSCTTDLNNTPKTRGLAPSNLSILAIYAQIFSPSQRFPTTSIQSSSTAVKTCPRYFNYVTVVRGLP